MAPNRGSVRAWTDDDGFEDEIDHSEGEESTNTEPVAHEDDSSSPAADDSQANGEDDEDGHESEISGDVTVPAELDFGDISFGALVKAQEEFNASTKRKRSSSESHSQSRQGALADFRNKLGRTQTLPKRLPPDQASHRTSKHAPTVQSSKRAVPRARTVFSPPASSKSRDPRFDPTVTGSNNAPSSTALSHANKNYAFLTTYRASELSDLRARLKNTKLKLTPEETAQLKREIASLQSKIQSAESRQAERDVLRRHRDQEKEAIREGKKSKAWHLKRSDIRKEVEKERVEKMGAKARDKMVKRRTKRVEGKEKKKMPENRRSAYGNG